MDLASSNVRLSASTEAMSVANRDGHARARENDIAAGSYLSLFDKPLDGRPLDDRHIGRLAGLDALGHSTSRVVGDGELVPAGAFETSGEFGERRLHNQGTQQLHFAGSRHSLTVKAARARIEHARVHETTIL